MSFPPGRACMAPMARRTLPMLRNLSTTTVKLSDVPPDSPLYIRLPLPPQTDEKKRERVRGFLPVPREIFPRRDGDRKLKPEYLQKTAPEPRTPKTGSAEREWKAELAKSRRQGLKEGLGELWERHERDNTTRSSRSRKNFLKNHELAVAPEREDDRLTRGTTMEALLDTRVHADPNRFDRAEIGREKTLAQKNAKREARQDALMELYISASNFITNEKDLRTEIEEVFSEDYFKKQSQSAGRWGTENSWGIYGAPPSIQNMMNATSLSGRLATTADLDYDRSVKRQKRIAEEFTGGKME